MDPYDAKPTRKRPLTLPLQDVESGIPTIVLMGPDINLRKALFRRLVGPDSKSRQLVGTHSVTSSFSLRGTTIELISLRGTNPVIDVPEGADCHFALCVDPGVPSDDESLAPYFSAMRALTVPVALAVVSVDGHVASRAESPWRIRLRTELLATVSVFRVDCSDAMSPELFVRLLIAPSDSGRETSGIEVDDE